MADNPLDEEAENENSEDSPNETNDTDDTHSPDGEKKNNQDDPDKDKPFHEHPRWKERETEWSDKFNKQEERHQEDIKSLREEFAGARKANAEENKIPSWFGGSQEQWDAYRSDRDTEIKAAEERAYQRLTSVKTADEKAVAEATSYMQSQLTTIESDKTINPAGLKIDPNKLLKIVMDNDLIDSKGRWNYKAGWMIYQAQEKPTAFGNRKFIAGAIISEDKGETKPTPYKTSADFKKSHPW